MAGRVPDCDTKELQQFKKNAEKRTRRKALRPGLLFGQHGLKKRIQSRYCKLRSQGNLREASEVFR